MPPTTAIGLDIGTTAVRAAELTSTSRGVTLERFGEVALPEGAVTDGEVVDRPVVVAALRTLWAQSGLRSKKVVLGVGNTRVIVRQVEIPRMSPADLKQALPFQVQDLLPIPVETAVLDFLHLEDVTAANGDPMARGMLVAASREMVMNNVAAVQSAGLLVAAVDLTPFAVLRSVGSPVYGDVDTEVLVDIGAQVTTIVVHTAGVPRFVRILLSGGRTITDAVAEDLGLPSDEAEVLKRTTGLDEAADPLDAALVAVDAAAQSLVGDIRNSLDYYTSSNAGRPPQQIVLSGGGSLLRGLAQRLTEVTRLPVVAADPLAALVADPGTATHHDRSRWNGVAAVPVGLAMGSLR